MSESQTPLKEINDEAAVSRLETPSKRSELPAATLYIGIFVVVIAAAAYFVFPYRSNQRRIAGLYLAKAKVLMRHDEFDDAVDALANARLADPRNALAETEQLKATIHQIARQSDSLDRILDLESLDRAEAACMRLLEENPGSAEITALLGIVYAHKDQPLLAFQTYRKAQELDPSYPNVRNYWGYSAIQWHFPDNDHWKELATRKFDEARRLDSTYVNPQINLALLQYFENNFEAANNLLSNAEKVGKENEILYELWGVVLDAWARKIEPTDKVEAYKKLSEALDKYRIAEALNPTLAGIHVNKGRTLDYLGRADAAMAEYTRALRLEPGLALAHAGLAEVLQEGKKRDDLEAALDELEKAIRVTTETMEQYKYRRTRTTDEHAQKILDRWTQLREKEKAALEEEAQKVWGDLAGAPTGEDSKAKTRQVQR